MKGVTLKEAAERWVRSMNAIPAGLIEKAFKKDEEIFEITALCVGDMVVTMGPGPRWDLLGEIDAISDKRCLVRLDGTDERRWFDKERVCLRVDGWYPVWGTMWSFGDSLDDEWLQSGDGIQAMSECGFRVYRTEDFGCFFGIDGAGYDFYESHWIPLYLKRGLKWHDESLMKKEEEKR